MNDNFVLQGVILGVLLLFAYLIRKRDQSNLPDGISLVSAGVGILAGIKLCAFSYLYRDVSPIKEVSVQTVLGGIAIIWVAVATAWKKFKS